MYIRYLGYVTSGRLGAGPLGAKPGRCR